MDLDGRKRRVDFARRAALRALAGIPVAGILAARPAAASFLALQATPGCADDEPTPSETAGPFYKPGSPRRASLVEPGVNGTRLVVAGRVLSTGCRPIAGALLDFWHTDAAGEYDQGGFRLRGHQFADEAGRFRLETIVPGAYGGRTRHIHVRVQAPHGRVLTTQLYFPGEPANGRDFLFTPRLLMAVRAAGAGREAAFDFVLPA